MRFNVSRKRIPFLILLICASLFTILSFVFLLLSSVDKGGASFGTINSYIGHIFETAWKNGIFVAVLLIGAIALLSLGVLFLIVNLIRNRPLLCLQGLICLAGVYEFLCWFSYFFCHLFGMSFADVSCSMVGFILYCVNIALIVGLFIVDFLTGNKKIAYIIQNPDENQSMF